MFSGFNSNMLDFTFSTHHEVCEELGKRLRVRRMGLNMTQAAVAALAGVSKGTVSNIEKHGQGTLDSMVRVLQAMRLTKELQPLFLSTPTSIEQLKQSEKTPAREQEAQRMKTVHVYFCGWGERRLLGTLVHSGRAILFEYSAEPKAQA